jgi:hypothetical protein
MAPITRIKNSLNIPIRVIRVIRGFRHRVQHDQVFSFALRCAALHPPCPRATKNALQYWLQMRGCNQYCNASRPGKVAKMASKLGHLAHIRNNPIPAAEMPVNAGSDPA